MKIGLIYGSDTGNTETAAETIRKEIGIDIVDIYEVFKADVVQVFQQYDFFILGIPTWYDGEVQSEWADKLDDIEKINLFGCKAAIYGLGDQEDWGEYFCDAMIELANRIESSGGTIIGNWSAKGYAFEKSKSLINEDTFVGLALDEDRQSDITKERIKLWIEQLKQELGVAKWQDELPHSRVVEA